MFTSHYEETGVLLFNGPARITPVIELLFRPFNLCYIKGGHAMRAYVDVLQDVSNRQWAPYLAQIVHSMSEEQCSELRNNPEPDDILKALAKPYGVDLHYFLDSIGFGDVVRISDVVRLARLIDDGHNLIGFLMQGARHGDGARIGEFGGWVTHANPHCAFSLSTGNVVEFANELSEALDAGASAAMEVIDDALVRLARGIEDPVKRRALKLRYALPIKDSASGVGTPQNWTRNVYVSARATDEGDGPRWAHLEVTPQFIRRLELLRGTCLAHQLQQIQVADRPVCWGPDSTGYRTPLSNARLVITPNSFHYSASPGRRSYSIETDQLAIDRFLETVHGPGSAIHFNVSPDLIRDQI